MKRRGGERSERRAAHADTGGARAAAVAAAVHPVQRLSRSARRTLGLRAAHARMFQQDKVWSRYSNDKVDIAEVLARVIRTIQHARPLARPLRALSLGSSNEPQFRILSSAFRGGLYLVDIEEAALDVVAERIDRQTTTHVALIRGDYTKLLADAAHARELRRRRLGGKRVDLVTLHHSLYYAPRASWPALFAALEGEILDRADGAPGGAAIHAVLMSSRAREPHSTTRLYELFAGRFCGAHNDQDLLEFAAALRRQPGFADARVHTRQTRVEFFVDDFERFMGVVWMVLLYPNVHHFTPAQLVEIVDHVYGELWSRGLPLVQVQDYLIVYRGREAVGLH